MTDFLETLRQSLDPEAFKKLVNVRASMASRFMKLADGSTSVRVLPGKPGKLWFREVQNHFKVGADQKGVVTCNATETPPDQCFVCDVMNFLKMSSLQADQEYSKRLRSSRIYWVNAYDPKAEVASVQILALSYTTFQQLFQLFLSGETSFLDIDDGVNVVITKQPGNKYFVRLDRNTSAIADPDLMEQLYDFDTVVREQKKTYSEQMALYPPELVLKMKHAGLVHDGNSQVTPPIEHGQPKPASTAMTQDEMQEQMAKLMAQVSKDSTSLDDLD